MDSQGTDNITHCLVCGRQALYNFYGALACDSCRTFFRRYLTQKKPSRCVNLDNQCEITGGNRRECAKCRFHKCVNVGMKPQLVASVPTTSCSTTLSEMTKPVVTMTSSSSSSSSNHSRSLHTYGLADTNLSYDESRLIKLLNGGNKAVPLSSRLKQKMSILRPHIPTIDMIILDMNEIERERVLELFHISHGLKLLTEEEASNLVGDPRKDVYTVVFTCLSRNVRALKTLTEFQRLSEKDQEILLRGSASEIVFHRPLPHLDSQNMYLTSYINPVTKERDVNALRLPAIMFQFMSDEIYNLFMSMVTGLFPEVREDFIMSIIITAIIFYDPDRPDLSDEERVRQEQDIYYNILVKYSVLKFGLQGIKNRLQGLTMRQRVTSRILHYVRRMKAIFEQSVVFPDDGKLYEKINQLTVKCDGTQDAQS